MLLCAARKAAGHLTVNSRLERGKNVTPLQNWSPHIVVKRVFLQNSNAKETHQSNLIVVTGLVANIQTEMRIFTKKKEDDKKRKKRRNLFPALAVNRQIAILEI